MKNSGVTIREKNFFNQISYSKSLSSSNLKISYALRDGCVGEDGSHVVLN